RCLPFHFVQSVGFQDSQCTKPILLLASCEEFGEWAGQGFLAGYGVFRVGAATATPATIWWSLTDADGKPSCVPEAVPPDGGAVARTLEHVPTSTFMAGKLETEAPAPYRLGARYLVAEDGARQ